jgi:hypothetical protein
MKFPIFPFVTTVSLACCLASCGGLKPVTSPPESTKFLQPGKAGMGKNDGRLPFTHSWIDPKVDITKYKNIVIRPVTTAHLRTENWEDSKSAAIPTKSSYLRHCRALAHYWDKALAKSFSSPLCVFYRTTDASKPNTLVVEIALTDVRFDRRATKNGPAKLPSGSIASALVGPPQCGFESKTKDAATGKLIGTAADLRGPEIKLVPDERKHGLAKPNEDICDEWSKQLMERWNPEIYPRVKRKWFSLF